MSLNDELKSNDLHLVMFPFFAFGHIFPFIELSNKLSLHGVKITFLSAPGNVSRIKSSLIQNSSTQIVSVPLPHIDGLPPDVNSTNEIEPEKVELLKTALDLLQPQIKTLLSQLMPSFVVIDFFQPWLPRLASELGVKTLCFSVFNAISAAYVACPEWTVGDDNDDRVPSIEDLMKLPVGFPSNSITALKKFEAEDFSYVFKSFDGGPSVCKRVQGCINDSAALILKSSYEMEAPYIEFIKTKFQKPVLLAGPIVPEKQNGVLEEKWSKWLSQFPSKSVIYCGFGSEQFLTKDQIYELTLGLEKTGLPFILVLNFPKSLNSNVELQRSLPDGFEERVRDRGIVHTGWVQQNLILGHESVGCILCHSGFGTIIEAITNDCQLVMLPFKGDHFFNYRLFGEDLKVGAVIDRRSEDGYFGSDDINEAIKKVMIDVDKEPGVTIRTNHKKMREFMLDGEIQDKFIIDMIDEMNGIV